MSERRITEAGESVGRFPFTVETEGKLSREGDSYVLKVSFNIGSATAEERRFGEGKASRLSVPAATFEDDGQAWEWAEKVLRSLSEGLGNAVLSEAAQTAGDEAHRALAEMKLATVDFDAIIRGHAKATTKRLREQFKRPGRRAKWTRNELREAVRAVLVPLPKAERTVAAAAARLKQTHPDKAPATAASLQMMLSRLGVSWREVSA